MNLYDSAVYVVSSLQQAGHEAYLVGGCVRDSLLNKNPKDYDVATSARPEQVIELFDRTVPTGIKHGTVTVMMDKLPVEVTTFRSEGKYTDGRRPDSIQFETDIVKDLSRRDFTINALAHDPCFGFNPSAGIVYDIAASIGVVDPFGGIGDIAAKTIRCVGDPMKRFGEDGLRCLRAVRFATVLNFSISNETYLAIRPSIEVFRQVSPERIKQEVDKILMSDRCSSGLELLSTTGLLEEIFDVDPTSYEMHRAFNRIDFTSFDLQVRYAVVLASAGKTGQQAESVMRDRLHAPTHLVRRVGELVHRGCPPGMSATDEELRRWLQKALA